MWEHSESNGGDNGECWARFKGKIASRTLGLIKVFCFIV
jgi:hypothetical protein